jgi:hypothetical protein
METVTLPRAAQRNVKIKDVAPYALSTDGRPGRDSFRRLCQRPA